MLLICLCLLAHMISKTKGSIFTRLLTPQAHPDASYLEGHKLVVRFRRPGVDLHCILQSNHQKFNPLVLHCRRRAVYKQSEMQHQFSDTSKTVFKLQLKTTYEPHRYTADGRPPKARFSRFCTC